MSNHFPCPFCGSRDLSIDHLGDGEREFFCVTCGQCEADGPIMRTEEGAVEAWNMRRKPDGEQGE